MSTGRQVNFRLNAAEVDKLKAIANHNGYTSPTRSYTRLIKDTIKAVFFSSASEQVKFLKKYAYQKNLKKASPQEVINDWQTICGQLEAIGITPEEFDKDWLPMVKTVKEIGLDINGTPSEIFKKASKLGAIITIVNALSATSEKVRQDAARDLLDRAGYKPVERVQAAHIHRYADLSEQEIDAMIMSLEEKMAGKGERVVKKQIK